MKHENRLDSSLRMLVKSSLVVFIGVVLSKIITYVYRAVIAKEFGPEIYGVFSLAIMICSLFITLASFGLSEGVTRYLSIYEGKKEFSKIKYLLKFCTFFILISSILFSVALFFLSDYISISIFHTQELITFLKIFSISVPLIALTNLFLAELRSFQKIGWYSFITNIFQNTTRLLLLIVIVIMSLKSNSIASSYAISSFIVLLFVYYIAKKNEAPSSAQINKSTKKMMIKRLIAYSWPIMFASIVSVLFYWIDSFVIGYFKDALNVGFYSSAVTIVALLGIPQDLFMQLFFPFIVKEYAKRNFEVIKETSKQIAKWIFIIDLPIFVLIMLFPGVVINLLFGDDFLIAQDSLRILTFGGFISILVSLQTNLLSMKGKSRLILFNMIVSSIMVLLLNLILVPRYGLEGAAIATSLVWIILVIILFVEVKHYLSIITLRRKMVRVGIAIMLPSLFLIIISKIIPVNLISLIFSGVIFIASYFYFIKKFNCLDKNDLKIINTIKSKTFFWKNKPIVLNRGNTFRVE